MYFEYQFPDDMVEHYHAFVPNIYCSASVRSVKTIVLMALRDLQNEELFSNYNFVGKNTKTDI